MANSDPFLMKLGLRLLLGIAAAAILAPLLRREARKSKWLLRGWAAKNGFKVLQSESCLSISSNRPVFRVRVRDRDGKERWGRVQCGSFLAGVVFSDRVHVKWEEK